MFDYSFDAPAVFAQDEFGAGSIRVSLSGRLDVHDEYGALASPRGSLLWRPDLEWTVRVSAGGGAFAPTPFVEETDETGLSRVAPLEGLEAERAWGGSLDVTRRVGGLEVTGRCLPRRAKPGSTHRSSGRPGSTGPSVRARECRRPDTNVWGAKRSVATGRGLSSRWPRMLSCQSREFDEESGMRREVPLTPRHYAALDLMFETEDWGRAGLELYYIGRQELDENPYRTRGFGQFIVGALVEKRFERLRVFVNVENLGNVRQTQYDPLVRPERHPDGRWTVDAWAPLDGRVLNGGVRLFF